MKLYFISSRELLKFSFKPANFLAKNYCIHAVAMIKSYLRVRHQRSSHCKAPGIAAVLLGREAPVRIQTNDVKKRTDENHPTERAKSFCGVIFTNQRITADKSHHPCQHINNLFYTFKLLFKLRDDIKNDITYDSPACVVIIVNKSVTKT